MSRDRGLEPAAAERELSEPWQAALAAFAADLRRRAVADKTLRAYAPTPAVRALGQRRGASTRPPSTSARCAASPPPVRARATPGDASPASWPRCAGCCASRSRAGRTGGEPGRAARLAQAGPAPAARAQVQRGRVAAGPDPGDGPLELRDRALFELAYACGLRAEELVSLDLDSVDFDSETVRVEGKGGRTRLVPLGEPAQAALERYLSPRARAGARPATARGPRGPCSSPSPAGG